MSDDAPLVTRWLDGFNRRDLEALLAVAHRDIVLRPMRWVEHREYRGHAGVREWLEAIQASPHASTVRIDRVQAIAPGRLTVEGTIQDGCATPFTALYVIRDGRLASVQAYMSDRALLEQLGMID